MRVAALVVLAIIGSDLAAQAPRITSKGDPSVRDDSLYQLAVDPADYPDEDFIYILDDGVVRHELDGTGVTTYRQIVQIISDDAVEDWAEQSFSWDPERERLRVNWIRVIGRDGKVISAAPSHEQVSDVPAAMENPVYGNRKVRRMSLAGVTPGTMIDYSVTTEHLKPFLAGDFYHGWRITTGRLTRRSRYILDVPAAMPVRMAEYNLDFTPQVRDTNGRKVWVWAAREVQPIEPEPFSSDSNGVVMHFDVTGSTSWDDIGAWYAGLARDRYALTPELESRVKELVAGAETRQDTLKAVHRWIAQDIRYVSISLGIGGYQPRAPEDVAATQYGDCKDKATLFIAMLGRLGITAYPVLLSAGGAVDSSLPSLSQFDHAIAAVVQPGGYLYVDLTSELTPLGELPPADQGQFALVVHPDGRAERVLLPVNAPDQNAHQTVLVGELDSTGAVRARYEESASGNAQYSLRQAFLSAFDSTERTRFIHSLATGIFSGSTGDELEIFAGKDLTATPRVRLTIRGGQAAKVSGRRAILTVPFGHMGRLADLANQLEAAGPRRFPIDAAQVFGPEASISELRLTLPEGWQAELPETVRVEGAYGTYVSEYRQQGRELTMRRHIVGARGILPPSAVDTLIRWLRDVAKDDTQFLVFTR
jgi:transglutaminase-like putative cysteine protease